MAVAPPDLLAANGGLVEVSLFPGEAEATLMARLTRYIADGDARATALLTDLDEIYSATLAWVYYSVFKAVLIRLSSTPSSVTFNDSGSKSFTSSQINEFRLQSEEYLAAFKALVPDVIPTTPTLAEQWADVAKVRSLRPRSA